MADRQGRVEVEAVVYDSYKAALASMSDSLRNVLQVSHTLARSSSVNANSTQALTNALKNATSASSLYARATDSLGKNQAVLAKYFSDARRAAAQLEAQLKTNTTATKEERAAVEGLIGTLKAQEKAREGIMRYSAQTDLRRQSDALNQLSSRYSMAGTRMSMALTLPIASFMRNSFANYRRLETETIRTTKLISDSYTRAADVAGIAGAKLAKDQLSYTREINGTVRALLTLEGAQKRLGEELDQVSNKYGIARDLVQGLAGDFAELGIEEVDTLAGLVDLTAGVEKLGNLDITASQEFIKSIFQTILRIKRDTGTLERTADGFIDYSNAVAETTQQLSLFNLIENKTQMSLKDIAKGFPEVTAAATSFGLTMTEATALVVPMVSAGMQVGASANSVKVSLQRVVDLTKENSQMIDTLKSNYKGFNVEAGVSVQTIQALADSYNSMKRGALAEQGTLEFFSRLFGVRQGPRMEVAIQNLAQFQDQLTSGLQALDKDDTAAVTIEGILARKLEQAVQQQARMQGLSSQYTQMSVKKFEDLGQIVRLSQSKDEAVAKAFSNARNELAVYVKDEAKKGNDLISKVSTESGKALFIGAIGNVEGQRKFQQEVEASLKSVEVRYQRARELIKSIGRQLVPILAEILSAVLPILQKINDIFTKIPSWVKYVISFGLVILAMIGPILKLTGSLFQLKSAMIGFKASGGMFGKLKSNAHEVSAELLMASESAFRFKNRLTEVGGKFWLQGTKKEIRDLTRLMREEATGGSPATIARLKKKLNIDDTKPMDMSGVSMATMQALKPDESFMGYTKELADGNHAIMQYTSAVKNLGEQISASLVVMSQASATPPLVDFDPKNFPFVTKTSATPSSSTVSATGLPRKGGKGGSSGGATGGTGGSPSGGSGGTPSGGSGGPSTSPAGGGAAIAPDVDDEIKKELNAFEKAMEDLKGRTKAELVELAKSLNIEKVGGFKVTSPKVLIGQLKKAIAEAMSSPVEKVKEATEAAADEAKKVADSIQPKAPPATGKKAKETSEAVTEGVAEAQEEKDIEAVKEQAKEDKKSVESDKPKAKPSTKTKTTSKKKTEEVAETQEKVDLEAVVEQAEEDKVAVKTGGKKPTGKKSNVKKKVEQAVEEVASDVAKTIENVVEGITEDIKPKARATRVAKPKMPVKWPDIFQIVEAMKPTMTPPEPLDSSGWSAAHQRLLQARKMEKGKPNLLGSYPIKYTSALGKGEVKTSSIRYELGIKLSTVDQMVENALNAQALSVDEVINSLKSLKVTSTPGKGRKFLITKEVFGELASLLGIKLPPIFKYMDEFTNSTGGQLRIFESAFEDLIQALTKTVKVSKTSETGKALPELVGETVLKFEEKLARVLATGEGSTLLFNLPFGTRASGQGFTSRFKEAFEPITRLIKKPTKEQRQEAEDLRRRRGFISDEQVEQSREQQITEKAQESSQRQTEQKREAQQKAADEGKITSGMSKNMTGGVETSARTSRDRRTLFNIKEDIDKRLKKAYETIEKEFKGDAEKIKELKELAKQKIAEPSIREFVRILRKQLAAISLSTSKTPEQKKQEIKDLTAEAKKLSKGYKLPDLATGESVFTPPTGQALERESSQSGVGNFERVPIKVDKKGQRVDALAQTILPPTNVSRQLSEAEVAVNNAQKVLNDLAQLKTELVTRKVGQTVDEFKQQSEQVRGKISEFLNIKDLPKDTRDLVIILNEAIEKARVAVQEAKAKASVIPSGGGGSGTTSFGLPSMGMFDPFGMPIGGQGRGSRRAPRIGPMSVAFVDKGEITGSLTTVYETIRQKLNIPVEVMDQVLNQLRTGYTDAEGNVRKAQNKINEVGDQMSTQISAGLDELVKQLQETIGTSTDSIDAVRTAIINARNKFYALERKAAKEEADAGNKQFGFNIDRSQRLSLAAEVANRIRETKTASDNFLEYQIDTLRYIARQFGFTGSGTKEQMRNFIIARLNELEFAIEGATAETVNAAIEASKDATAKVKKKSEKAEKAAKKAEGKTEQEADATTEKPKKAPRKKKEIPAISPSQIKALINAQMAEALKTLPVAPVEPIKVEPVTPVKPKSARLPKGVKKAQIDQLMGIVKPAFDATVDEFSAKTKEELLSSLGVFKAIQRETAILNYILEKYGIDINELIKKTVDEIRNRSGKIKTSAMGVSIPDSKIIPADILKSKAYTELLDLGVPLSALEEEFKLIEKLFKLSVNDLTYESEESLKQIVETLRFMMSDTDRVGNAFKDLGINIDALYLSIITALDMLAEDAKFAGGTVRPAGGGSFPPLTSPTTPPTTLRTPPASATATATTAATKSTFNFIGSLSKLGSALGVVALAPFKATAAITGFAFKITGITKVFNKFAAPKLPKDVFAAFHNMMQQNTANSLATLDAQLKAGLQKAFSNLLTIKAPLNILQGYFNIVNKVLSPFGGVGSVTKAMFKLYDATLQATLKLIPFGTTIYKVFVNPIKTVGGAMAAAAKEAKAANTGIKGFVDSLRKAKFGFDGFGKEILSKFSSAAKKAGGGVGGLGQNIKSGLVSNIGMSAGMLGSTPLGMFGGNMLQSLITSISAIPVVGMPAVLILTAITGTIALLVKTQKSWGEKSEQTSKNFKEAFDNIKAAAGALLKPLEDMFGAFIGGNDESGTATEKARGKFEKFSEFVLSASRKIKSFVETTLAPAFRVLLSAITVILRRLAPVLTSTFNLMRALYHQYADTAETQMQRVREASESFTPGSAAQLRFVDENLKNIQSVSDAWNNFKDKFGALLGAIGTLVTGFVGNLVIDVIRVITKLFVDAFEQVLILINNLIRWTLKGIVGGIFEALKYLVRAFIGAFQVFDMIPGVGKFLDSARESSDKFFNSMRDGSMGLVGDLIDGPFDALNASIGSFSNLTDAAFDKLKEKNKKKYTAAAMEMIKGVIPEGSGAGLFKSLTKLMTQAFKDPAAAKAAGEAIKAAAKAQADAIKDINSKFFDKAVAQLEKAMGDMTSKLTESLNKQKDDALKAFDDQIAGIEALAEAEERLTATEEYESNKRQRIRDRELQRNNYQKERALAIYEGRIDDARNLDLEELKNTDDFNKEISDMDKARQKELQSQNRQDAITIIRNQRDEASKLFDQAIKEFEDYIQDQLRNGTTSEEEFRAQFQRIASRAQSTSTQMNDSFRTFFTNLPTVISNGLNPVTSSAGFFSTGFDSLIATARTKFGIDTQTSDPTSILGVTRAMLSGNGGMSSIVSSAFAEGGAIRVAYGTGIDTLNTYVSTKLKPSGEGSLSSVFTEAMKKANEDFLAEIEKGKTGAGSKIESLAKHLNEKFKALALKDIMKGAITSMVQEIQDAAGDAGTINKNPWTAIPATSVDRYIGNKKFQLKVENGVFYYRKAMAYGGLMPKSYADGGFTSGFGSAGIPAMLHGGEFVLRKSAVDKYGLDMLSQMNQGIYVPKVPKFNMPMSNYAKISGMGNAPQVSSSETTHNYNFYVDNFIGETEWFNSMMKEYNMKVVPANQKQAGLESRVIKTYNGINRGM